jgi:hypothetical protein
MNAVSATLLSRACTTGWLDWVWGELWSLPDGVIRVSSGWSDTLSEAIRNARDRPPGAACDEDDRNRWIRCRRARLRQGSFTSRLHAELIDGSTVKLLWMKRGPGFEQLRRVLGQSLGGNLELR